MPEPPFERECQKSEIGLVSTIYLSTEKYIVFLSLNYLIGKQAGFATCRPCSQGSAHKLASEPQSNKVKANDKVASNRSKSVLLPNPLLGTCLTQSRFYPTTSTMKTVTAEFATEPVLSCLPSKKMTRMNAFQS